MSDEAKGTPFSSSSPEEIDEWSRSIFEFLSDWPVAEHGRWSRWEPGYLLLEVDRDAEGEIEPLVLYTADDELTLSFGFWETHLPDPNASGEDDAADATKEAKQLVADWLAGRLMTAVYFDANGKWCGSITVEGEDITTRLQQGEEWIRDFKPARIELRRPRKSDWRFFTIRDRRIEEIAAHPA